jgi:hypothetical protein
VTRGAKECAFGVLVSDVKKMANMWDPIRQFVAQSSNEPGGIVEASIAQKHGHQTRKPDRRDLCCNIERHLEVIFDELEEPRPGISLVTPHQVKTSGEGTKTTSPRVVVVGRHRCVPPKARHGHTRRSLPTYLFSR